MNESADSPNRRILVIDDNQAIHSDFRKILSPSQSAKSNEFDEAEAAFLGEVTQNRSTLESNRFEVDSAFQGQEGLELVTKAVRDGNPYALAFVDVRMPPGWDGCGSWCPGPA